MWHPWWLVGAAPPVVGFSSGSGRAVPCLEGLPREPSRPPSASSSAKAEDEPTGSDLLGDERPLTSQNQRTRAGLWQGLGSHDPQARGRLLQRSAWRRSGGTG